MRKITFVILVLVVLLGCCGCRNSSDNIGSDTSEGTSSDYTNSENSSVQIETNEDAESSFLSAIASSDNASKKATSSKSASTATASASTSSMRGQTDLEPVPESLNWGPLYGDKYWEFYTTAADRTNGAAYYVIRFHIDREERITLSSGGYVLKESVPVDVSSNATWALNGTTYYMYFGYDQYNANLYINAGSEDKPVVELRCYDGSGRNFLTDKLNFKRIDNDTLQYIGDDYEELMLRTGDIFTR